METARRAVQQNTVTVTAAAAEVDNFASDAELSAVHAHLDQELAGAWAEFLEGNEPIPAMYFAHTAITGQHWSSRWWAHKAAGAFGAMSELYLGAHPTPPTTTSTGEPIPIGAIYYNTTNNQVYVWNGTEWMPFWNPAPALVLTLVYQAAAGQTVFPLTTPDLGGNTYTISAASPEPASVFVNGVRLPQDAPVLGMGDWLIDNNTSTVTMNQPLKLGDTVQIDLLAPASSLAPSRVQTQQLLDFDIDPATDLPGEIDGATASFPLVAVPPPHAPIPVTSAQELFVSVDGVVQQPGTDYNVSGGAIHFGEPLIQGARAWALWYGPGAAL
jgi:hypothetical protein